MFRKLFLGFVISLFILSQGYCAVGWLKTKPAGTTSPADLDTNITENNNALDLTLSGYVGGCKLSYDTVAQLTVGAGGVMVNNSDGSVRLMLANTSATTVTWSNIDTGSEAASTTYYVYAIGSATTDTVFTVKISTSSTAPTGITYYKQLGSFYNDSNSNITLIRNDNTDTKQFGSWVAKSADTVYQATTDGFVMISASSYTSGSVKIYTDSSNPPTTKRADGGGAGSGTTSVIAFATSPVKQGNYYKATNDAGGTPTVYWIPLE